MRKLLYPFHPWHGEQVWIKCTSVHGIVPVYHCSLEPDSGKRQLEIPQWMFDAAAVCLIRCEAVGRTSTRALRELKELISGGDGASGGDMVQVQQQSRSRRGGSDASRQEVPTAESISTISPTFQQVPLGEPTGRGAPGGARPGRAMAARPRPRRRAAREHGGAR